MNDIYDIKFGSKAKYEIIAIGSLETLPADFFGDITVDSSELYNNRYKHIFVGILRDQAELSGLLNAIYEMHLTVFSVNYIEQTIDT